MQYRISFLLLVVTITAMAFAGRPWLIGRNDFGVAVALFAGWVCIGFLAGRATASWEAERVRMWTFAIAGVISNWMLLYTTSLAATSLRSPDNVLDGMPHELGWLIDAHENQLLVGIVIVWTLVVVAAAWMRHERIVSLAVAFSLLTWFVVYWWSFVRVSLASDPLE